MYLNRALCGFLLSLLIILCNVFGVSAQNEIERERSSLKGVIEMGFTMNVEATGTLNNKEELAVNPLKEQAVVTLQNAGLDIVSDEQIRSSADLPFLYMHINTMDAGQGLVPFSISLDFYQPATLTINQNMQTSVSTWQTGMVGIVSYDKLNLIGESAVNILHDFITDYHQVNR